MPIEGGVRVRGDAVLNDFRAGIAVILIFKCGNAVLKVYAVCGKFEYEASVIGKNIVAVKFFNQGLQEVQELFVAFFHRQNYRTFKFQTNNRKTMRNVKKVNV